MSQNGKILLLQKQSDTKIKDYISKYHNPSKVHFFDPSWDDRRKVKSISEVLQELNFNKKDHKNASKFSDDKGFQLHLRCPTDSCFVKNYFGIGLLAWEASIVIQPVFNYHEAVTNMCSYLSKEEDECSQAMKQVECSLQETVYYIMPELWARKIFSGVFSRMLIVTFWRNVLELCYQKKSYQSYLSTVQIFINAT